MLRFSLNLNLKNLSELCLYAGISCGVAFIVRLEPAFFFPVLILRLAFLAYCWYVIILVEGNREFGAVLGAAILVGWLGGYWDYFELELAFNQSEIIGSFSILIAIIAIAFCLFIHWNYGKEQR